MGRDQFCNCACYSEHIIFFDERFHEWRAANSNANLRQNALKIVKSRALRLLGIERSCMSSG
ncbi:Transposase [Burkholderia ubonensis]|nr:hypothetical protein BUB20358_03175 [Burkholderia ubonensis]